MKYIEIGTPYGSRFIVNELGYIVQEGSKPSGQWIMKGIKRVNSNEFISFSTLLQMDLDTIQWTYKNGNPRYTVVDLDHGTTRIWGNTKYHGIWYICKVEKPI